MNEKKKNLPTYEVVVRTRRGVARHTITNNVYHARQEYNRLVCAGADPQLLIDGVPQLPEDADRTMHSGRASR